MKTARSFEEALSKKFTVTAELVPPKGADFSKALATAKKLSPLVDALNVTDNQRSVMRFGSLGMCHILQENGIESIFQICCRDRNRLGLQSDLLNAHALGIRNVLAVTGDHPKQGDHPGAKPVFDVDSVQLLDLISSLNSGLDMNGASLEGKTDFFPGAAANPESELIEAQLIKMRLKAQNGARFFQTQPVYDIEKFKQFIQETKGLNAKVLAGIFPLLSAKTARFLNAKVPGVRVPDSIIIDLERAPDPKARGLELAAETIQELRHICAGIHLMTAGKDETIPKLLELAWVR